MTGQTVLGRYPGYVELGEQTGARYFNVPTRYWNAMTAEEQWAANVKFLDRTISRGDEIILSTNPLIEGNLRGPFAREIQYMVDKGWKISADSTRLLPPGAR